MTTIIGITHPAADLPRYFTEADLDRLRAAAEVRILGSNQPQRWDAAAAGVGILLGSWGMPKLDAALLARLPALRAVCYAAGTVKGFVTDEADFTDFIFLASRRPLSIEKLTGDRRIHWLLDHEHRFPENAGFVITDDYNPMESRQVRKSETYRKHFLERIAFDLLLR